MGVFLYSYLVRPLSCQPIAKYCNKDPLMGIDLLRPAILTVEAENIRTLLPVNFKGYGIEYRFQRLGPLIGKGIFTSDGEHWATSRALIRPIFAREQVADLTEFEKLITQLSELISRGGSVIDLQELFFRYSIDSATAFLFGQSVGSQKKTAKSESDVAHAFDYAQESIRMRKLLGPLGKFYRDPKADRCNKFCQSFGQQFVDEAIHAVESDKDELVSSSGSNNHKYIFSHELARRTTDRRRILDEVMNHPAVWSKLRKEIASLDGRVPTFEEVRSLKYLKCCKGEALRLHPVVPLNSRVAICNTVLPVGGGRDGTSPVFVAKGTQVACCAYAMHRRADIYGEDSHEFRPERPRLCIGQQYALTENPAWPCRLRLEESE
ncbi:n-alkane-inducible cytochrome P450 [Trichoderma evansii]